MNIQVSKQKETNHYIVNKQFILQKYVDLVVFSVLTRLVYPNLRVCDGYIDCNGPSQEDESGDCLVQHSCSDWLARGSNEDGEYLIDVSLTGKQLVD